MLFNGTTQNGFNLLFSIFIFVTIYYKLNLILK